MTVNYSLGKIYILINTTNKTIYVGSTAQVLMCNRMGAHRRNAKDSTNTSPLYEAMRALGIDRFKMLLHHLFPCSSKAELEAEEYRVLDQLIDEGRHVYNQTIGGKHSAKSKEKMSLAQVGTKCSIETKLKMSIAKQGINNGRFSYGCVRLDVENSLSRWLFLYVPKGSSGTSKKLSFSCLKYGFWEAKNKCDQARKEIYPEYKDDEERCIEAFMNINLN